MSPRSTAAISPRQCAEATPIPSGFFLRSAIAQISLDRIYGSKLITVLDRWRFSKAIKVELNLTKKIIL